MGLDSALIADISNLYVTGHLISFHASCFVLSTREPCL
jgi:hypothetical protein